MAPKTSTAGKTGQSASAPPEAADVIPLRYGDDPYVWACWLYYEDGRTQSEIAEIMGISRATVNSYLADARSRGIVNISLEPSRLSSITIAQELKRHFHLQDCYVVPNDEGKEPLIDRLGKAGGPGARRTVRGRQRGTPRRQAIVAPRHRRMKAQHDQGIAEGD